MMSNTQHQQQQQASRTTTTTTARRTLKEKLCQHKNRTKAIKFFVFVAID